MSAQIPQLPEIEDFGLLFEILTHKDISPTESESGAPCKKDDTERLAELGENVLNNVVTYHLFSQRPPICAEEIKRKREAYTSSTTLSTWLDNYPTLKQEFRAPRDLRETILGDHQQMARVFHSYVGAVFTRKGFLPIQAWISRLIDPDANPESAFQFWKTGEATSPSGKSGAPSSSPSTPAGAKGVYVPQLNEVSMKKKRKVHYIQSSEGPSHQPTWVVKCYIDDVEKGVGEGTTVKVAREIAALEAWKTFG